ncbi:MAG: tripartite tricarboxylate transporter TctB family protein [Pseudomonadota bacterium]
MPNVLNADLIIGFFSLAFGGVIFAVTRDLSHLGGVFVNYVLIAILFLAVIMIIKGFVKPEKLTFFESVVERNNILIGLFILLVYLLFMPKVGFLPASYIFYACFNIYLAEDRWTTKNIIQSVAFSAVVVTLFFLIFHFFLAVPLPIGSWFEYAD